MAGELWLVSALGHCGTLWLSQVLDAQPGIRCYHELKYKLCGPWHEIAEYDKRVFASYWDQLARDMLKYPVVCDVNSWHPLSVPKADRVISIVRNGITQLHSLYTKSVTWRTLPLDHYVFTEMIEQYAGPSIYRLDRWGRMCALWAGVAEEAGEEIYRFEGLVQGDALRSMMPGMSKAQVEAWQRRDINRKVVGSRDPADIWAQWTPEMRETFTSICREGMVRFGYHIPEYEAN